MLCGVEISGTRKTELVTLGSAIRLCLDQQLQYDMYATMQDVWFKLFSCMKALSTIHTHKFTPG
jgi:hypothetical protein